MANRFTRFIGKIFTKKMDELVRERLTLTEDENTFFVGTRRYDESERDRLEYDRADVLAQCLDAWRESPLARRVVELTSQYVIGPGFDIKCQHEKTKKFIDQFWSHRLNRMSSRVIELCDELTRTGNLFLLISTDPTGMSYVRAIPATDIDLIEHSANDIEQPVYFETKANENLERFIYPAYNAINDEQDENGQFEPAMVHYAINRPAGAQWGEPDLAPLLPWLRRYSAWLEDRVRLNRFRNAFVYVVTGSFASEAARKARQTQLATNPPNPGSILVCDESETWTIVSPKLEALDAMNDGLAIKKTIAAGVGIPLHFLAEPEGSNRSTAESAGGPTFRRFEQRQQYFGWLLEDLLQVAVNRRAMVDYSVDPEGKIEVTGADISARDNVSHSIASVNMMNVAERMKDMGLISDRELMRIVYRFAGEGMNIDEVMAGGSGVDKREVSKPIQPASKDTVKTVGKDAVHVETGAPKQSVLI